MPTHHKSYRVKKMSTPDESQTAELLTLVKKVDKIGTITYHNSDGEIHRIHGPAAIASDGSKAWYRNGKLHREDGPAIEWQAGDKEWHVDGELCKIEYPSGKVEFFVNGELCRIVGKQI